MAAPVELIPLVCARCQNPVAAQSDEIAWVCEQCGQGLLLSEDQGTQLLEIHFSAALKATQKGRPFWVARGTVELDREVYGGGDRGKDARQFWGSGRTFLVPAFTCPLEQAVQIGQQLLNQPAALQDGPAVAFEPVTMLPEDMRAYADFIVMAVEAGRPDKLKDLKFNLALDPPVLWVLA